MPVARGSPPVMIAVPPGSESEGSDVCAFLNSLPPRTSLASSELGWLATYHLRSDWCIPSTEINRTCLTVCSPRRSWFADSGRTPAEADPAARLPSTATQVPAPRHQRELTISHPFRRRPCRAASSWLHPSDGVRQR